jgi:hypothetical protein
MLGSLLLFWLIPTTCLAHYYLLGSLLPAWLTTACLAHYYLPDTLLPAQPANYLSDSLLSAWPILHPDRLQPAWRTNITRPVFTCLALNYLPDSLLPAWGHILPAWPTTPV